MSKPVDVRNKLADKALELFNANGYEKTSVNSICAAANVSRTRFYSLFSDKKDLIMWTMRDASLESNIEPSEILFLDNDFYTFLRCTRPCGQRTTSTTVRPS